MNRTKLGLLIVALACLWGADSSAADAVGTWPSTLWDEVCDDADDVPAQFTPPFGSSSLKSQRVQTSGDPDGFCDSDSAIRTGAFTVDTNLGPIRPPAAAKAIYISVDVDEAASGTWRLCLTPLRPYDGAYFQKLFCSTTQTGDQAGLIAFGITTNIDPTFLLQSATTSARGPLPGEFVITVDLITATSVTGSLAYVWAY